MLTLFSVVQPVLQFLEQELGQEVNSASGMKTTDNQNTQYGVLIRRLINTATK